MMLQTFPVPVVLRCLARPQWGHVALLVGLALSLSVANRGQAATTWTVCASGCDYRSIKAAIAAPTTLDGDTLAIAAGIYTEPSIIVDKSLTLQGEGAASTIVQAAATRGTATDRVFLIPRGVSVTLKDLMIRYGHSGAGGGIKSHGTLTLTQSTVSSNTARYSGGGIRNYGTLTLTQSTVRGNSAGFGGGLDNSGTLTLTQSTVSSNRADSGGGLINEGTLTLTHSTISGNTAGYYGGGLYNGGTLTLRACLKSGRCGKVSPSWSVIRRVRHGETLSDRSHRSGMGDTRTVHPAGQSRWPASHNGYARGGQCHRVCPAQRLPMAHAPERLSAVPNGV
jgi:hypothetical protein